MNSLENSIPDFEPGPLDRFRSQASFNWKKMKLLFNDPEIINYKANIWNKLKQDPLFHQSFKRLTHDELRKKTYERVNKFKEFDFLSNEELIGNFDKAMAFLEVLIFLDPALAIKYRIGYGMFASTVLALGSKDNFQYGLDNQSGKITGSFALTEIAHGSNVSGMMTTATYIKSSKEFELNTPSFEAAKCWVGVLGQTADYAIVFANLISSDGQNHGLHPFIVPIRDVKTKQPFPGLKVGDLGEKIGLNGVDNGWVMFNKYRIPKENLLSKTGSLDSNGKYLSSIKDPKKRMGSNFGVLSTGRIAILGISTFYLIKALTIALRYSLIRKQFGPPGEGEYSLMEYQTHQYRLIPFIATAYVHYYFAYWFSYQSLEDTLAMIIGDAEASNSISKKMPETHALSSAIKAHAGWASFEGIQQCREACGGHGYLKAAGIGDIRNDNDANIIYEGENTVIIQQTSRWLISLWKNQEKSLNTFETPYESVKFLADSNIIHQRFQATSIKETLDLQTISNAFKWLIHWLLTETTKKMDKNLENGQNAFDAQNNSQIFYAKNLSLAYIQHFAFIKFWEKIVKSEMNDTMRDVLINICALYGAWHLEKHLVSFYQGGYATNSSMGEFIHEGILKLCKTLKPDALALIETLAPPDFVLNSVLGQSNGDPYGNMEKVINADSYNLDIPNWLRERFPSKL